MSYLIKRLAIMIPTLVVILLANFVIVQSAPTGPIQTELVNIEQQQQVLAHQGFTLAKHIQYQGHDGMSEQMIQELTVRFGFDKPAHERFLMLLKNYATFELGQSFFKGQSVASLIGEKLPISLVFGGITLVVMYGFGVMIGGLKTYGDGGVFDKLTTVILAVGYAIPVFMVAVLLIVVFAGSRYWQIFPMQVNLSGIEQHSFFAQITTLCHQLFLPVLASSLGGVASIAYLTKFSLSHQLSQSYVLGAKSRGLTQRQILSTQVFKNALLPIMAEMPMAVVGVVFVGNFLVEIIFGIDGMGRLGFDAVISRDYPVMFGVLYVFTLISMVVQLVFDVLYQLIDPRVSYQ